MMGDFVGKSNFPTKSPITGDIAGSGQNPTKRRVGFSGISPGKFDTTFRWVLRCVWVFVDRIWKY